MNKGKLHQFSSSYGIQMFVDYRNVTDSKKLPECSFCDVNGKKIERKDLPNDITFEFIMSI